MSDSPNSASALVIEATPADAAASYRSVQSVAELRNEIVMEADAIAYLQHANTRDEIPDLIFVGAKVQNIGPLTVELQRLAPSSHVFFMEDGVNANAQKAASSLVRQPVTGLHWSTVNFSGIDFAKSSFGKNGFGKSGSAKNGFVKSELAENSVAAAIAEAAQASRQRRQLRSTLDQANQQIHSYRTAESPQQPRASTSDHYLASFLAHAQDAVIAVDARARILYWSAGAEKLFGLSGTDVIGTAPDKLPFWTPALDKALADIPAKIDALTVESTAAYDEREIALESTCAAVRDETGRFIGISLVIRDVTERQQRLNAERAEHSKATRILDTERRHLRRLFEQAPGFIAVTIGPQHVFEVANDAYRQIIGHRSIIGKSATEALPEMQGQDFLTLLDQVYARREPYVGRGMAVAVRRQATADMETRFIDFVFQPIIEGDGTLDGAITGIFCQGTDVTEHRLTQEKLAAHQQDLERLVKERTEELQTSEQALHRSQKLEAIGQLTGGVAHDFNNVLQIISSSLQLLQLQEDKPDPERVRQHLSTAIHAVERGSKLSSQLLAFARRQPLRPSTINLARVVRRMDDLLRRALGEPIEIETVVAGGLWNAMADPSQLENVILNLAINARDAMPEGGKLTLEVGNAMLDDNYVLTQPDVPAGQYVLLAISDTGRGMTAGVMERVFDPFFTTKKEGEGTGLGLSMAYGFTKQSGGHIRIYSEPGSGTTLKIYLPRSFGTETEEPRSIEGAVTGGTETILVVEDDPGVRDTAVFILKDLGYEVLQAHDGQSALNVLQSGVDIDMLFTDVVMPGPVRSTELAKTAAEMLPNLVVLFTSGYTQNAIIHGGRLDPGVELLSKPYRREELAQKVRSLLSKRATTRVETRDGDASEELPTQSLRILVVEDDFDSQTALCQLLAALDHQSVGVSTAEDALEALGPPAVDVLITDLNLPGMSGIELARRARERHPTLKIIIASGDGTKLAGSLLPTPIILPKPFDLAALQRALELAMKQ